MDWKKLHYLIWLLPAYLLFQSVYQVIVYNGLTKTYKEGTSYIANVDNFMIRNLQAQSYGSITLSFHVKDGRFIRRTMTLPVKLAQEVKDYEKMPIRYLKNSSEPIIMIPPYNFYRNMVRIYIAIAILAFLIGLGVAITVEHYFWKRRHGLVPSGFEFELVDSTVS